MKNALFKCWPFLLLKPFCQIKLNKSARRVWLSGPRSPNPAPSHLRDDHPAAEGGVGSPWCPGAVAPSTCHPVAVGPESCSCLSPANPAARCLHAGPHTPQPSSQSVPGASRSIGRSRAGAGIPHQCPTTDSNSTEHRNQTPKPSVTASLSFGPLGAFLSVPLETAILTNQTCNCGIIFKPPTSSCFIDAETEAQRGPATCSASHSYYV